MKFSETGLHPQVLEGIASMGFEETTPVQAIAIPMIMEGKDVIASAQTGTGKTAAFLLPVIHKIIEENSDDEEVRALVIVPTRELAIQIDQQMEGLSYFTNVSSIAIYGGSDGTSFAREKKALMTGAKVIIGTPGRLIAHLNMGYTNLKGLKYLILDEADRMLDMGFHEDILKIISHLPKKRQNLMFSATMPKKIRELANTILHEPEEISIAISKPAERIVQGAFCVYPNQKIPLVSYLLSAKKLQSVIIFCGTKQSTKELARELKRLNFSVEDIHSDLDQNERETVLRKFRNRELNILVATDILSRGIDVEDIDLVINFDVPGDGEDYIHRIGRTARASSKGVAFTLIDEDDMYNFNRIEELLEKEVQKIPLPESIGEGPAYNPKGRKPNFRNKGKGRRQGKSGARKR